MGYHNDFSNSDGVISIYLTPQEFNLIYLMLKEDISQYKVDLCYKRLKENIIELYLKGYIEESEEN